jgi:hypothetical protein
LQHEGLDTARCDPNPEALELPSQWRVYPRAGAGRSSTTDLVSFIASSVSIM